MGATVTSQNSRVQSLSLSQVRAALVDSIRLGWANYKLLLQISFLIGMVAVIGSVIFPTMAVPVSQLLGVFSFAITCHLLVDRGQKAVWFGKVTFILFNVRFLRHSLPAIIFTSVSIGAGVLFGEAHNHLYAFNFLSFDLLFSIEMFLKSRPVAIVAILIATIIDFKVAYLIVFQGLPFGKALALSLKGAFKNPVLLAILTGAGVLFREGTIFGLGLVSDLGMGGLILSAYGFFFVMMLLTPFLSAFPYLVFKKVYSFDSVIDLNQFYNPDSPAFVSTNKSERIGQ